MLTSHHTNGYSDQLQGTLTKPSRGYLIEPVSWGHRLSRRVSAYQACIYKQNRMATEPTRSHLRLQDSPETNSSKHNYFIPHKHEHFCLPSAPEKTPHGPIVAQ